MVVFEGGLSLFIFKPPDDSSQKHQERLRDLGPCSDATKVEGPELNIAQLGTVTGPFQVTKSTSLVSPQESGFARSLFRSQQRLVWT